MEAETISFKIPGPPQGKARPRVVRAKNGMSLTYTPDKTVRYEELVRLRYQEAAKGFKFADNSQVYVSILAVCPIPSSKSKKAKAAMLSGEVKPTKKPDCDNIVKIICDALNGIAYKDDAQIVAAHVEKMYGNDPHVKVELSEIE